MMRPTVRSEMSARASRLQIRNSAGIRMRLLQVIDLHHQRQPDFARRRVGCRALVDQPGEVFGLEALDPGIDGGAGDVQKRGEY